MALSPRSAVWCSRWRGRRRAGCRGRGVRRRRCGEFGLGIVGEAAVGSVVRFGASSEEAVLQVADLGLELSDLVLESFFALSSAEVHGFVVMGLLSEGDDFEAVGAGLVKGVAREQGW
jgi:hypothetical protein